MGYAASSGSTRVSAAQPARWVIQVAYSDVDPKKKIEVECDPDHEFGRKPGDREPVVQDATLAGVRVLHGPLASDEGSPHVARVDGSISPIACTWCTA